MREGLNESNATEGKTTAAVLDGLQACSGITQPWSIVVMDNYYSSPELYVKLHRKQLYALGTIRTNRKHFPQSVVYTPKRAKAAGLVRGGVDWRMGSFDNDGRLLAAMYLDNKPVHFLSTYHGAPTSGGKTTMRYDKRAGGKIPVFCPDFKTMYDYSKGGVDRFDQMASYLPIYLTTKRPWQRYFFHLIQIMYVTAYQYCMLQNAKAYKSQRTFRAALIREMLQHAHDINGVEDCVLATKYMMATPATHDARDEGGNANGGPGVASGSDDNQEVREGGCGSGGGDKGVVMGENNMGAKIGKRHVRIAPCWVAATHAPMKVVKDNDRRRCATCRSKSGLFCKECGVHLCMGPCWIQWHKGE